MCDFFANDKDALTLIERSGNAFLGNHSTYILVLVLVRRFRAFGVFYQPLHRYSKANVTVVTNGMYKTPPIALLGLGLGLRLGLILGLGKNKNVQGTPLYRGYPFHTVL